MTLETIADRIISDWESTWGDALGTGDLFNAIKSALQAAREEGRKEGYNDVDDQVYAKGFSDAAEKAAEIIADYQWSHQNDARHRDALMDRIKSLKPETQGNEHV